MIIHVKIWYRKSKTKIVDEFIKIGMITESRHEEYIYQYLPYCYNIYHEFPTST